MKFRFDKLKEMDTSSPPCLVFLFRENGGDLLRTDRQHDERSYFSDLLARKTPIVRKIMMMGPKNNF